MAPPSSPSLVEGSKDGTEVVQSAKDQKMTLAEQLVLNLCDSKLREEALVDLSKVLFVHLCPPLISAPSRGKNWPS
jgi:hypothetical protein